MCITREQWAYCENCQQEVQLCDSTTGDGWHEPRITGRVCSKCGSEDVVEEES